MEDSLKGAKNTVVVKFTIQNDFPNGMSHHDPTAVITSFWKQSGTLNIFVSLTPALKQ